MRKQNTVEHLATLGTLVGCYEKSLKVFKFLLDNQRRLWYNKTIVRKEKISHVKYEEESAIKVKRGCKALTKILSSKNFKKVLKNS